MATNMLSVTKLKLHGIQDVRWTVHHQKSQYKGLVKLFERDRKITDVELKMNIKKNKKETKYLLKDSTLKRQQLDACLNGDRQTVNNLLAVDMNLKNAYKNISIQEILDHLFQNNFSKRKSMDLFKYRLEMKKSRLCKLRLEEGDLITHQLTSVNHKTSLEKQIGVVTGKVQDMILKKEATITVNATYKVLVDLLRKDAIYYNAVLDALSEDSFSQGHCLMQAITLGQLATEHLDTVKVEYENLQGVVKIDRKVRIGDIDEVESKLNETARNMRTLVRKDSDLNMGFISNIKLTSSYEQCSNRIDALEKEVNMLQNTLKVTSFEDIFPCLKEQAKQAERLKTFLQKSLNNYGIMDKKRIHAEIKVDTINNNNFNQQSEYESKKETLLHEIKLQKALYKKTLEQKVRAGMALVQMRASLQNIESMCKIVGSETPQQESDFDTLKGDCNEMMKYILYKVSYITSARATDNMGINLGQVVLTPDKYDKFTDSVQKTQIDATIAWKEQHDDDGEMIDDSSVPTRADIKEASRVIYDNFMSTLIV